MGVDTSTEYEEFIASKLKTIEPSGFSPEKINQKLFPFQRFIVERALLAGRYAIFADCGLGKTIMQLEWAAQVVKHTGGEVLILAPLSVTWQTVEEAEKWGISLHGITVTNYEQVDNLDCSKYVGVVLDESSIIKNYSGATKEKLVKGFLETPYKLACTATPSPNDPIELGSHSEFLNVLSGQEMLSLFFINDGKDKSEKWKLKGHAEKAFYQWVSTWAVMLSNPSDIGFPMDGYVLPKLNFFTHHLETDLRDNGELVNTKAVSAIEFNAELRRTQEQRLEKAREILDGSDESFLVIVKQNDEGKELQKMISDSREVCGSDSVEYKAETLKAFAHDQFRVLISKNKIIQFGLNFQNCHNLLVVSLDFSFEGLYQAIRREWRFGQKNEVNIHIITTDSMQNVKDSIESKMEKFRKMQGEMVEAMRNNLGGVSLLDQGFNVDCVKNDSYEIHQGDSVELIKKIHSESVDISIFSPPFSSLYTYSDNARDLSNCASHDEFFRHFGFLVGDLLRITKPGRLCCLHLTQLTTMMGRDGFYSIVDFRGDVIRLFQSFGWRFHAEATIWKDPELAAVRTKCHQLLHKSTKSDATIVRPGLADYLVCFRKPGENAVPVNFDGKGIPFELWCEYASPVWMDINASDTLQYRGGRDDDDVKHITPTQLEVWKRALTLWSNPGDVVFTPFMGIGSEVWQAVKMGRRGLGFELKESYFSQAKKNLSELMMDKTQGELF